MPRRLARLGLVLALLAVAAGAASASTGQSTSSSSLARRLQAALATPGVARNETGALAVDLVTGKVLYAQHQTTPFVPASNEKLVVAYAALVALGPEFRIATDVLGSGHLQGTTWRGDLVLAGHGDPDLDSNDLVALARQIRRAGIRRVAGSVVGEESFFDSQRTGPGWKPSFYINECPPLSALVVDRGVYRGRIAARPALAAAALFRRALEANGVKVDRPSKSVRAGGVPLASVGSAPLSELVAGMDTDSDNFIAEMLLKELGAVVAHTGTSHAGAAVATRVLREAEVPLAGVRIVDGSGLSYRDRLTSSALVAILDHAWSDLPLRPVFLGSLAVAGRSGTLEHRMEQRPAYGAVRAKTGTTDVASALSGFVRRRYAFSILQNGRPIAFWSARSAQDRFAEVLAAQ